MKPPLPGAFDPRYELPYLLGVYLGANAVSDAGLLVDGLPCAAVKADFIAGNHDLNSTLLSEAGAHRVMCTARPPVNPDRTPEKQITGILESAAGCGRFGAVLLTALPFLKLTGADLEGLARGAKGRTPVETVPVSAFSSDWLDGYAEFLDALARLAPAPRRRPRRRTAAIVGYLMDRNEADHAANLAEFRRLLGACGVELVSVWPCGGPVKDLWRALEAELVISLPYGRKAARRLAGRSGAALVETGVPVGPGPTRAWLEAVLRAGGWGKPTSLYAGLEREAAAAMAPALPALAHKRLLYCGDPHLYEAVAAFAAELCLRPGLALLNAAHRALALPCRPRLLAFAPGLAEARRLAAELPERERPDLALADSFALSEGFHGGTPAAEFGFPSYGRHCLAPEPFLGLAGGAALAGRLLNLVAARR